ncbi:bifunctional 2-polyprenyl-6-hydroxyphenol methylase/3-demethylubiquinol 3-O-methyltransferase UbiG [Saccharibacillus sp. JS10]|uniref:class I SAM-dependent methyltransferase n=1 Tax=Saccharibacillus sp. JS10 TaxID=2950552 RepID=UPI00210C11A1|nr:class I SAM-dependent methyltransferase [Saccharibacillus sp. JS10]MCQ4088412.1 class I SAM-dependent methyltransferase [Saccharibacillus sp. JS10]
MYDTYGELCTEVYDLSKPLGFTFGDVEFYLDRLSTTQGKVLEVGCGSGRVLIPLLQAGIDIDGLDNSEAMLESCKKRCDKLQLQPNLFKAEMYDFSIPHKYEAIIIPGGSFQLIEGREQAISALRHFKSCLQPNGRLILDLFMPTDFTPFLIQTKSWDTPSDEVITLEDKRIELNVLEQKIVSLLKYEKWKNGKLMKTELQRLPLSWYGKYEFDLMVEKLGYEIVMKSADYKQNTEPEKAGQMITYELKQVGE